MKDVDDKFTYSNIISLRLNSKVHSSFLYPNPVKEQLTIMCPLSWGERKVNVTIYNSSGQKIDFRKTLLSNGKCNVIMPKAAPGIYFVMLQDDYIFGKVVIVKE